MKKLLAILAFISIAVLSYYTHRLWVYAGKLNTYFDSVDSAINCLIQESGQNESDIDVVFKGYKTRESYAESVNKQYPNTYPKDGAFLVRKTYNDQIPQCHIFYTHYRCWALDPHDPGSLDGCGLHFGLLQSEIDTMKKDPSTISSVMDAAWKRETKDSK